MKGQWATPRTLLLLHSEARHSSDWVRFNLGLIAGMVLAVLVPIDTGSKTFERPLLALLGGFSASVVYRILQRLVDTLESSCRSMAETSLRREAGPTGAITGDNGGTGGS